MKGMLEIAAAGAALLALAGPVFAADLIAGPVRAEVVRVVDGDTIEARAQLWIGLSLVSSVRIRGIDTPEMRGSCIEEKAMAAAARDLLAELAGASILLTAIENDKYAGRVLADVAGADGDDLAGGMIAQGYARPYDGGSRADWCLTGSVSN